MNRRELMQSIAASAAASSFPGLALAHRRPARLVLADHANGPTIPADFMGLSYEAAQLANPDFFSRGNRALVGLFRSLSPNGNLRIGGGSSEYTTYSEKEPTGAPPFEVFGPDTSKTKKHGTVTSARALRNLRGFLDATGWSCLYGLNLGQGSKDNAVREAAAVQQMLGSRLVALQIGNEPDSFRRRYRPADWGPSDFIEEWKAFHAAIAERVPNVRFAGPDISNKLPYLTAFAEEAPNHQDVILLTGHYYAMGPAGSPDATLEQLMQPDPKKATMHLADLPVVEAARRTARLPYRMSEGNSCWDGGQPGVSDTHASALWCADAMLRFGGYGWSGVNWHGGGNGFYTPIAGAPSTGFTRRPVYFAIQMVQMLSGASFIDATLDPPSPYVNCHALKQGRATRIVLINKSLAPVPISLPRRPQKSVTLLTGPSLQSKEGTKLGTLQRNFGRIVEIPAHSAMLLTI